MYIKKHTKFWEDSIDMACRGSLQ